MDRAAVQTILADLMPASHTIHNKVSHCSDLEFPPLDRYWAQLHIGRRHAPFLSVSFCRPLSSEMGFAPDNTVRIAMTISRTSYSSGTCSSRPRSVHGSILLPLQPRGESSPPSMSFNPLVAEGVFFPKARSCASNRPSLFPGLSRCALQAWLALPPRLLRATAAPRVQVTHAAYTTSRGHCPFKATRPFHTPL